VISIFASKLSIRRRDRPCCQPTIVQQGSRWIAYVGTHGERQNLNPLTGQMEDNGTMVIDVTDPKQSKTLAHIPGGPPKNPGGLGDGAQASTTVGNIWTELGGPGLCQNWAIPCSVEPSPRKRLVSLGPTTFIYN
jgi:hypothetical protein